MPNNLAGIVTNLTMKTEINLKATLTATVITLGSLTGGVNGATIIDTTGEADRTISTWGPNGSEHYGQVIEAPASETQLDSFTFSIGDRAASFNATFAVATWTGTSVETVLYSEAFTVTSTAGNFLDYTFSGLSVPVTAGFNYIAYVSADQGGTGGVEMVGVGAGSANPLAIDFAYNNGTDTTTPWSTWSIGDTSFRAEFSSIPEPSTSLLLGLGALGLASRRRRSN